MYEYSAENHDWDLTLNAAETLLVTGYKINAISQLLSSSKLKDVHRRLIQGFSDVVNELPPSGNLSLEAIKFSSFTSSMLLSFCAIESFMASIAFRMAGDLNFKDFDFDKYRRSQRFWDKMDMLCLELSIEVDKSQGLFQTIQEMQEWRNLVTHASPYKVDPTKVAETAGKAILKLHTPYKSKEYTRSVKYEKARKFYVTALEFIQLLEKTSGLEPRAQAVYTPVPSK